jgi:hypothetical protein
MTLARGTVANRTLLVGRFSLPFTAVFAAVFDRLFGEDESKAVGESITWQFRPVFSPFKNGENGGNDAASNRQHEPTKAHPALVRYPRLSSPSDDFPLIKIRHSAACGHNRGDTREDLSPPCYFYVILT